jgi:hypothetical protein
MWIRYTKRTSERPINLSEQNELPESNHMYKTGCFECRITFENQYIFSFLLVKLEYISFQGKEM